MLRKEKETQISSINRNDNISYPGVCVDVFLSRVPQTGAHFSAPSLVTHSDLHRVTQTVWERVAGFAFGKPGRPPRLSDRVTGAPDPRQRAQGLWLWCCCCGEKEGRDPSSVLPAAGYLSEQLEKEKTGKKSQTMQVESERKEQKKQEESKVWGKGWRKLERNQGGNDVTGKEKRKW